MNNTAITVQDLSKKYHIGGQQQSQSTLQQITGMFTYPIHRLASLRKTALPQAAEAEFWALRDINFEVPQGQVLGIIGKNGAGKSTLLKILSGITRPTEGRAIIRGRVGSLLEVGTGFHAELTGRENIYLNGSILGLGHQEIKQRFDEIVEFSGVESFLDTPIKRYSSGMKVRLAFSVAAHLDPEILLIDEVLSVGDTEFQRKSLGKMQNVTKQGRTVIFVSHQLDMVRALCDRCILLEDGRIRADSIPDDVIEQYRASFSSDDTRLTFEVESNPELEIQILSGKLTNISGEFQNTFDVFDPIVLEIEYVVRKPLVGGMVNLDMRRNGATVFLSFDTDTKPVIDDIRQPGRYRSRVQLPSPLLKSGRYTVDLRAGIANRPPLHELENILGFDVELLSHPSALVSYAEKRRGVVAVLLDWATTPLIEPDTTKEMR